MDNLKGMNLELLSVSRKGIFDIDAFAYCCDNCGRTIVNSASVRNIETGQTYTIGLDCKKTLIDKKHIEKILSEGEEWETKYKVKEYKAQTGHIEKFLSYFSNLERFEVSIDPYSISVCDNEKEVFAGSGIFGACVYSENQGYLYKIGLKTFIEKAIQQGKIKASAY